MKAHNEAKVIGVGAAACAVCCAGPILAFLGAIGLGTIVGVAVLGAVGLLVALLAAPLLVRRRRRRCDGVTVSVPVEPPALRARS